MAQQIVIIGAGHNGLTTAAYLARAGHQVLVLEQRTVLGGCAVTEEVDSVLAPGCRVSTASYIASMLSMEVINDLKLGTYALNMVACEPGVQAAFEDSDVVAHWNDHALMRKELERVAPLDVDAFFDVDRELKLLAAYLQPFFLQAPPDVYAGGWRRALQGFSIARQFRGISGEQINQLMSFLTGSLGDLLDRRFKSDKLKRLILANSLYGKHGGPYQPGTAMGLLFHLLSGGEDRQQGFQGHVIGGMGAITQALAAVGKDLGVIIRTDAKVRSINIRNGIATGVTLENGEDIDAEIVVSNADPKNTYLKLLDKSDLEDDFRQSVDAIRMNGPCAKVNFVLSEEPKVRGMPKDRTPQQRALFTLVPTLADAEDSYHQARSGKFPDKLWVDCVLASNVDNTLAPAGRHMLTCFVQYVPYRLAESDWNLQRERLGDEVTRIINSYAPNMGDSIVARDVITPLDLETRFGLTEGNIFHGDIAMDQLFFSRPLPGWCHYRAPVKSLYLCGAGTHPGGGVTGAPGYNAAHTIMQDIKS